MTALATRDQPHLAEHQGSMSRRMDRGKMPKSLPGLLHWFVTRLADETPERLHKTEIWRDKLTEHEREDRSSLISHHAAASDRDHLPTMDCWCEPDMDSLPVGGSLTGAQAYGGLFKLLVQGSANATDEDGYYLFPIRSALARLHYGHSNDIGGPLMSRFLFALGMARGDWRRLADARGWQPEEMETYTDASLRRLWHETYDREKVRQ